MIVEGNPPAPTELKIYRSAMKCFFNAFFIKTCAHVPLAYLCEHPCARHCASDGCRGRCSFKVHTMHYIHYLQAGCALVQLCLPLTCVTRRTCALNPSDLATTERVE